MRQILLVLTLVGIMVGVLYGLAVVVYPLIGEQEIVRPVSEMSAITYDFDQYSIENLRLKSIVPSSFAFDEIIEETNQYTSYQFSYYVEGKRVSGLATIPADTKDAPVILMYRGFIDPSVYEVGDGTRRAGQYFAQNGFITLAPDFLGFGESDMPSAHPMEERFERYTTGLALLTSITRLNESLEKYDIPTTADEEAVGIWGHSNGGHIAIIMLEVTGEDYPTTLWAPVSKPFPYSILFYTDEYDDYGKALRKLIAEFEEEYNVDKYSLTTYLDWIKAPIQLHQGGADIEVPQAWSDEFVELLEEREIDVTYFTYLGNDHNLSPNAWNTVVRRDVQFFREQFEERE
ncbi:prolyl oligopeptidase family serine peptidase [Candidatus Roizmanbacteria bacterium]|nr:prolyl oligopeptidase family serine peptidase [Candidatus Roizmanbacteria bacterium]